MRYLIDTNICIYIMNQRPLEVVEHFKKHTLGDIGISSVTISELYYGVSKSQHKQKNTKRLQAFLLPFKILNYDEAASIHYGDIRANLESQGNIIGALDMMIAAHARSQNVTLVTNNESEFLRVLSLQVENWAK